MSRLSKTTNSLLVRSALVLIDQDFECALQICKSNLKGAKALFHIQSVHRVLDAQSKVATTNLLPANGRKMAQINEQEDKGCDAETPQDKRHHIVFLEKV